MTDILQSAKISYSEYRDRLLNEIANTGEYNYEIGMRLSNAAVSFIREYGKNQYPNDLYCIQYQSDKEYDNGAFDFFGTKEKTLSIFIIDRRTLEDGGLPVDLKRLNKTIRNLQFFANRIYKQRNFFQEPTEHSSPKTIISSLIATLSSGRKDKSIDKIQCYFVSWDRINVQFDASTKITIGDFAIPILPLSLEDLAGLTHSTPIKSPEQTSQELSKALTANSNTTPISSELSADSSNSDDIYQDADSFRNAILVNARHEFTIQANAVFDKFSQIFSENEIYEDINPAPFSRSILTGRSKKKIALSGYAWDETLGILRVFLLDFPDRISDQNSSLTSKDASELFERLKRFLRLCQDENYVYNLNPNTIEGRTAVAIRSYFIGDEASEGKTLDEIELVLLTIRHKSSRLSLSFDDKLCGIPCSEKVWDFKDLYEVYANGATPDIDFTEEKYGGRPLRLLKAVSNEKSGYSSYLGCISGETLARIYKEQELRVLSGNVRAFLLTAGKVNSGIQETIKNIPERFFAYNNGICVVADSISCDDSLSDDGVVLLRKAMNFQIVNGGQTTASVHYAMFRKHLSLEGIVIPMKLSVVTTKGLSENSFDTQEFIQNISKYANSQNKVNDSDLGSNTRFQVKVKELSKAPGCTFTSGRGTVCHWYYERARGSYKVESAEKKNFEQEYPKQNKFDKKDLAKWLQSWQGNPQIVSLGAEKCFVDFSRKIQYVERLRTDQFEKICNQNFFKISVAKGILFKYIDNRVSKSDWYKQDRGFKANIVAYTVALLATVIHSNIGEKYALNFLKIFNCIPSIEIPQ